MGFQHGLSGLNAASKNLDVIGHNVANSSTTGFKSSRADFAEMVASAIGSSSGSTAGIGVNVAAVSQQFTQGAINSTGNSLDLAVNAVDLATHIRQYGCWGHGLGDLLAAFLGLACHDSLDFST